MVLAQRTTEDKKIANFVRMGEGFKNALLSLESVHGRMQRVYPNREHEYRETFQRAYDAVQELYAAVAEEYRHNFPREPHTLAQIVGHQVQWPDYVIEALKADEQEAE